VQVTAGDGRAVFTKTVPTHLDLGITRLLHERLDTKALKGTYTVKAEIAADDRLSIAVNACSFDVFAAEQLTVPEQRIAVFDPDNSLKPFLEQRKRFGELAAFIEAGGSVVYLQGGGPKAPWGVGGEASPLLPIKGRLKQAVGTWTCIPHIVKDHPVFGGLPVNCMMGPIYENVWAQNTLLDVGGETIVAAIGYDWFPDYDLRKRHYYGPGDTWWGADLAVVPLGKGRCIVSQLRLVENLGKDPVADRILFNLIQFASR
jgi:hypothetical protein